jgi:NAD(P)-dependent dehydrogenase (short-subunit alcohol dehydrogenase family)
VVIGATGTLGAALAEGIAQAGATVVVAGRSEARGHACVERIRSRSGEAGFRQVDVCDRQSIRDLWEYATGEHGRVDMLVNCAGVNAASSYEEATDEDWQRVLETNLRATHWGCQEFAPQMAGQPQGGSILNIGSVTSHLPLSRVFAYSASKAAVVNLTKNVAREFATRGVRVNALCPGFFPAEQNRKILDQQRVEQIMQQTPMARFGEPEELVGAALLLLSRRAGSYITGCDLYVDGGFTAMRF